MKKSLLAFLPLVILAGCTTLMRDGIDTDTTDSGIKYKIQGNSLTVLFEKYQLVSSFAAVLAECREKSWTAANELGLEIEDFDFSTERNGALGVTSCVAFGKIKRHK